MEVSTENACIIVSHVQQSIYFILWSCNRHEWSCMYTTKQLQGVGEMHTHIQYGLQCCEHPSWK